MEKPNNTTENKIFTIPNALSFFRICLITLIIWLYVVKIQPFWAGYILILSGITDIVDGFIARHFHMISNLGKVLDPIADKLTQAAVLICLIVRFPFMLFPFILLIAKETFMGITGFLVIHKTGIVLGANWHGKVATALLYLTMIIHIFGLEITDVCSVLLISACSIMITVSFALYGMKNIKILHNVKINKVNLSDTEKR